MQKWLRVPPIAALGAAVVLGVFWLSVQKPTQLLSVEYPDGGTLRVYYVPYSKPPFFGFTGGGLKYRVRTSDTAAQGWLTPEADIDVIDDTYLSHEVVDGETIRVITLDDDTWLIKRDGTVQGADRDDDP